MLRVTDGKSVGEFLVLIDRRIYQNMTDSQRYSCQDKRERRNNKVLTLWQWKFKSVGFGCGCGSGKIRDVNELVQWDVMLYVTCVVNNQKQLKEDFRCDQSRG